MKVFHCGHCQNLLFFENVRCLRCDRGLAYLPDFREFTSLEETGDGSWRCSDELGGRRYRLCQNYTRERICNWAIPEDERETFCQSCRLTEVLPDLSQPANQQATYKLESAKRRLIYSLIELKLPLLNRRVDPQSGLAFRFLSDPDKADEPQVITGHADGTITVNLAEADDAEREKRRVSLNEPYRTLLGHFRHEIGHYYWDRLIRDTQRLTACRELFGDERRDYSAALKHYYEQGPPTDWQQRFVSAYCSAHPWEDWAETWAHYLHMTDTLETAAATGLTLKPTRRDEPSLKANTTIHSVGSFDRMIDNWFSLTYILNNLNRGLGLPDGYPFVLPQPAIEKLRFIDETIRLEASSPSPTTENRA
jgi:hypothetical protein